VTAAEAESVPEPAAEPTAEEPEAVEQQVVEDTATATAAAVENVVDEELQLQLQPADAEAATEETVPLPDITGDETAAAPVCPLGKVLAEDGTCR